MPSEKEFDEWIDENLIQLSDGNIKISKRAKITDWIKSFTKEQSKAGGFSLEDKLLKWIDDELKKDDETESGGGESSGMWSDSLYVFRNKIQSFTKEQPKADIVIECEMEYDSSKETGWEHPGTALPLKIKLNKDGQPILTFK